MHCWPIRSQTKYNIPKNMKNIIKGFLAIAILALGAQSLQAGKGNGPDKGANFGSLFYKGETVGTVATPTSQPGRGIDTIYVPMPLFGDMMQVVTTPADGQLGITTVAPGDRDYHGGRWAVEVIRWKVQSDVRLLTSEDDVIVAYESGEITMERVLEADFVCPVRKNK